MRNPWNEYECGSYYARAMASYGLLIALSGFRYSAPSRTLTIEPQLESLPFTCFFSTATGWGTLTLGTQEVVVALQAGELFIETLIVKFGDRTIENCPKISIQAGKDVTIPL